MLKVAIIGGGPAGMFAAEALLKQFGDVEAAILDRSSGLGGLVNYGVAPDHQTLKKVLRRFMKTAEDPRVHLFGNVTIGHRVTRDDLIRHFDRIIYCVGAQSDHRLNIPGERSRNVFSATSLVGWYNNSPFYENLTPSFSGKTAVVAGAGNVAVDIKRILGQSCERLETTDIADYALRALRQSQIEEIVCLVRRSPAQVAFSSKELAELAEIPDLAIEVNPKQLELDDFSKRELEANPDAQVSYKILRELSGGLKPGARRKIRFEFLANSAKILAVDGKIQSLVIERTAIAPRKDGKGTEAKGTGEFYTLPVELMLRAIGYRICPVVGVPFLNSVNLFAHDGMGRVLLRGDSACIEHVAGWAGKGPRPDGLIGDNKDHAFKTVSALITDVHANGTDSTKKGVAGIVELLDRRKIVWLSKEELLKIDAIEKARGAASNRPRVKLSRREVNDILGKKVFAYA